MARKAKNIVWDGNYEVEYTNLIVRRALNKAHINWDKCVILCEDSSYITMKVDGADYFIKKWNWYCYENRRGTEKIGMNYTLYKECSKEEKEEQMKNWGFSCNDIIVTGTYENNGSLYQAIYKNC